MSELLEYSEIQANVYKYHFNKMEKRSGVFDVLSNTLPRCDLCKNVHKDPRMLSCLHTYCKACLIQLAKENITDNTIKCPECKMPSSLPERGVDGLHKNLFFARLGEMFPSASVQKFCSVCLLNGKRVNSLSQCLDCLDFLCKTCSKQHLFSSVTSNHRVVLRKDLAKGKYDVDILAKRKCCAEHKEELMIYCKSCKSLVCVQCMTANHMGHDTTSVSFAAESAKSDLITIIHKSRKLLNSLEQQSNRLLSMEHKRQFSENSKLDEVNSFISKIKEEGEKTVKQINSYCDKQKEKYHRASDVAQALMTSATNMITFCDDVIARVGSLDLLLLTDTMEGSLATIEEGEKSLQKLSVDTSVKLNLKTPECYFSLTDTSDSPAVKTSRCNKLTQSSVSETRKTELGNKDEISAPTDVQCETGNSKNNKSVTGGDSAVSRTVNRENENTDLISLMVSELERESSLDKRPVKQIYEPKAFKKHRTPIREEEGQTKAEVRFVEETKVHNEENYTAPCLNTDDETIKEMCKNFLVEYFMLIAVLLLWLYFAVHLEYFTS